MEVARPWFPQPFQDLRFRQVMPGLLGEGRPVLVAHKVSHGWDVYYYMRCGQPAQQATVRERTGRMSRILLPLMTKMGRDIEGHVSIDECGWVSVGQLDSGSLTKSSGRFRKDKSDLIRVLETVGLGIVEAQRRIRLDPKLARERARLAIFEG
jgi:hypothetical protein